MRGLIAKGHLRPAELAQTSCCDLASLHPSWHSVLEACLTLLSQAPQTAVRHMEAAQWSPPGWCYSHQGCLCSTQVTFSHVSQSLTFSMLRPHICLKSAAHCCCNKKKSHSPAHLVHYYAAKLECRVAETGHAPYRWFSSRTHVELQHYQVLD